MKACCSGCSLSPSASPSTVRMLAAVGLDREHQAGAHRIVVEDDGAGAADAVLAADMGPGLAAVVADGVDQGAPRLDPDRIVAAIDVERDVEFVGGRRTDDGGPMNGVRACAAHVPLSVVRLSVVRPLSSVLRHRPFGRNAANLARMRASSSLLERASMGKVSRRAHGLQASMTTRALRGSSGP